jgi:NTP pyrophosphatase (non-canonical NTP hydrolase)
MHEQFVKYGTPATKLVEECAELIQAICKGERFGYDDRNPLIENAPTCRERVVEEIADVENALSNFKSWLNELSEDIKRRD